MLRTSRLPAAAATALVAVALLAGCGADAHLQRQAAGVRSTTCQSIVERQERRAAPHLASTRWLSEVARPPHSLSATINEREIIDGCFDVEAELAELRSARSTYLEHFAWRHDRDQPKAAGLLEQALGDSATSSAPGSGGLARLLTFLASHAR